MTTPPIPRIRPVMVAALVIGCAFTGCGSEDGGSAATTTTSSTSSTTASTPAIPTVDATVVDPPAYVQPLPPAEELLAIAADPQAAAARAASVVALTPGGGAEFVAATGHPIEDWLVVKETQHRTPEYVLAVLPDALGGSALLDARTVPPSAVT